MSDGGGPKVVQVTPGEDLLVALRRLGEGGAVWIAGVGTLEDVELAVASEDGTEPIALSGTQTLTQLSGPGAGPFAVTLSSKGADGIAVASGLLGKARSVGVSLAAFGPNAALETLPRTIGSATLAEDEEESDVLPEFEDRVLHPVFGLCDVMVARGERLKIRDVEAPHRLREIHLGVMRVLRPVEQDGRRVFRLVKRS